MPPRERTACVLDGFQTHAVQQHFASTARCSGCTRSVSSTHDGELPARSTEVYVGNSSAQHLKNATRKTTVPRRALMSGCLQSTEFHWDSRRDFTYRRTQDPSTSILSEFWGKGSFAAPARTHTQNTHAHTHVHPLSFEKYIFVMIELQDHRHCRPVHSHTHDHQTGLPCQYLRRMLLQRCSLASTDFVLADFCLLNKILGHNNRRFLTRSKARADLSS